MLLKKLGGFFVLSRIKCNFEENNKKMQVRTDSKSSYNLRFNKTEFFRIFRSIPKVQQIEIAKKINIDLFDELWASMDKELPNVELSEVDILNEVKAVRYGKGQ